MGGIPDIKRAAKMMGDFSALSVSGIPERIKMRGYGFTAGRVYGFAKSHFGVIGLFAFAEFISYLNMLFKAANSSEYWVGNMTRYAGWVDRGFVHYWNGLSYPPTYFYRDAVVKAINEYFAGSFFTGYGTGALKRTIKQGVPSSISQARTGIYEGQKFLGDMYAVLAGDFIGRVARREAGRATAGFVWGTLVNPTNMFYTISKKIIANARRNIRTYPSTSKKLLAYNSSPESQLLLSKLPKRQRVIYDTGMLWATMALGKTESEFMNASFAQGDAYASKKGFSAQWVKNRMSYASFSDADADLHGPMMSVE